MHVFMVYRLKTTERIITNTCANFSRHSGSVVYFVYQPQIGNYRAT